MTTLTFIGFFLALMAFLVAMAFAIACRGGQIRSASTIQRFGGATSTLRSNAFPWGSDLEFPAEELGYLTTDAPVDDSLFVAFEDRVTAEADGPWDDDDFLNGRWSAAGPGVNPATGLPMVGAFDVAGNPYGFDLHTWDHSDDF